MRVLLSFVLAFIALFSTVTAFDWATGNSSVWISAAAYCETNTYLTRTYKGASKGFVAKYVMDDKRDVQGFIGYLPSQSAIYVSYRGSTSIKDWVNNLEVTMTDYPRCSGCKVHHGFYKSEQGIISYVISSVKALKSAYPNYKVVVTGHSLGAALATLTSMDLKANGLDNTLFMFGSPRVGNDQFAAWASSYVGNRNRVTHYKDMVPHVPMHERFTHISGEYYEDQDHSIKQCSGYEDPTCSYQWHITNIDDHMHYLNLYMGCDAVSAEF